MSLRKRLILFFITLIGLLGLAQWWLLSALTEQLEEGRREDALLIGKSLFEQIIALEGLPGFPAASAEEIQQMLEDGVITHRDFGLMSESEVGIIGEGEVEVIGPAGIIFGGTAHTDWTIVPGPPIVEGGFGDGPPPVKISVLRADELGPDGKPLGFDLDIPFAGHSIDRRLAEFRSGLILGTSLILLLALLAMVIAAHKLGVPLRQLAATARKVEGGNFGETVATGGGTEVGEVIQAFNSMSLRLEELQDEAERLKEQAHLTELGELARGLAHAMRNPLHVIGLSAQRLTQSELEPDRRMELASSVHAQVQRVDRAMRNFLALSSAGQGHLEEVSLVDTVRDVSLELMQGSEPIPEIQIEVDSDSASLSGVPAEVRALVHVVLTNAVEASGEDAREPIHVNIQSTADGHEIEVLDRGCGLADDVQNKLFTPHYTTKEHGAGLGLFLARRIAINRYRGGLEIGNRGGGGCRAILRLNSLQQELNRTLETNSNV